MTEQQARELAELIRSQLPFHILTIVQAADMRNAPRNWFIGIKPSEDWTDAPLLIHSRFEWDEALLAWRIIKEA